jgi:hypothetical protein
MFFNFLKRNKKKDMNKSLVKLISIVHGLSVITSSNNIKSKLFDFVFLLSYILEKDYLNNCENSHDIDFICKQLLEAEHFWNGGKAVYNISKEVE